MDVVSAIDKKVGEVRTESIDLSIGEIVGLHQSRELVIQPDFQRLFRWSYEQRSRLVESLLLQLPIPSVFVIENESGILELIDGLQRISSLLHFIDAASLSLKPEAEAEPGPGGDEAAQLELPANDGEAATPNANLEPLRLEGCDLVQELNGNTFEDLPLTLRLKLKRTPIRTVVIKRQSSGFLRYEMFKRLNTGGAKLSDQDIRNVNARMLGKVGVDFYSKLVKCAAFAPFRRTIELLPASAIDNRADEELVLRFFATKNFRGHFRGNVGDWLDGYMETVLLDGVPFDGDDLQDFYSVFTVLSEKFGPYAFVKYRQGQPLGGVAPAYFEAVTMAAHKAFDQLNAMSPDKATEVLAAAVESLEFRRVTGPGANSLPKLEERIAIVSNAFAHG